MTYEQFVKKVLSVAKIGLKYSTDSHALENYEELEQLSLKVLNENNKEQQFDHNVFVRDIYPTPNMSVRTLVLNENDEILFVKEKSDEKWAVPGGWCDLFISPQENAIKEISEESGLDVEIERLVCVFQRELYKNHIKPTSLSEYVFYFVARVKDPKIDIGFEVSKGAFFAYDALPELSFKNTKEEIDIAWDVYQNQRNVYID